MATYKITVKGYMTKEATPEFDFMAKWNNNKPMPLRTMIGTKEKETRGMVYMNLHGDIFAKKIMVCMKCGRPITNPVSQFFGMGPECGGHNYVNPFNSEAELNEAVGAYRKQLQKITWSGWVIKSAILNESLIDGDTNEEIPMIEKKQSVPVINAKIDKSKSCYDKQSAFLTFAYDTNVLDVLHTLSDRHWDSTNKQWEIPASALDVLKKALPNYTFNIEGDIVKEKAMIPVAKIPDNFNFKTKPFKHQIEGFEYGLSHDRFLLGDEQGLGKTKQVIDIAIAKKLQRGYKHCLIICGVNGLKWNWQNEIKIHSNESGWIIGQRTHNHKITIGSTADKLYDLQHLDEIKDYFIITNIESIRSAEITDEIVKLCKNKTIGLVAIDEIHKAKNPSSQQGKAMLKIKSECRIAMTGTPLMNTPIDLYIILKWLGYEEHSLTAFKRHYCIMGGFGGYEIVGYKNLDELQSQFGSVMLRRLKSDVLDLPEKTYIDEYVEMTAKQNQIYREVSADIQMHIDQIKASNNPLAMLIRLRQATGYTGILSSSVHESAKLDRMEELVAEAIENGKKVVIFSNWLQMTDPITERLSKYNPIVITGNTKDSDRQHYVEEFQNNSNVKVAIGTIGAMGTGITLTAGTVVIFTDEPWTNAAKEQAIDRCHRIGTKENISIYTLQCKNTIDERIHEIITKKGLMSDALVDGKVVGNKSELLDYLLS